MLLTLPLSQSVTSSRTPPSSGVKYIVDNSTASVRSVHLNLILAEMAREADGSWDRNLKPDLSVGSPPR